MLGFMYGGSSYLSGILSFIWDTFDKVSATWTTVHKTVASWTTNLKP